MNTQQERFFSEYYGVNHQDLEKYLAAALSAGGDYADLYFEYLTSTSLSLDESMVKSASQGICAGCGVRVVTGERTGYAYTDDLAPERILHAARTAALIASGPAKTPVVSLKEQARPSLYPVPLPSVDAELTAKVELVFRADKAARAYDPRIKEVRAGYARRAAEHSGDWLRRNVCRRCAAAGADECVRALRRRAASSAKGTSGGGGRVALEFFLTEKTPEHFAKEAARQAILQLMRAMASSGRDGSRAGAGMAGRAAA